LKLNATLRLRPLAHCTGRLHSKLTGAGGGGCAISLIDEGATEEEVEDVRLALEQKGVKCQRTSIGGEGLVNHSDVIDETSALMKSIMKRWMPCLGRR
jgi:galactokinase